MSRQTVNIMNCPKPIISQSVLYLLVMQGDDVVLRLFIKFILTASPLSPLLPFWPGPPVSPYVNTNTHKQLSPNISKHFTAVLQSTLPVRCNYLISVLSRRPVKSRSPWQPYRPQFPIMASRPHRPLLSLGNRWENSTHLANATILIILI